MMALTIGRRGPDVARWQRFLTEQRLLSTPETGIFDEATDQATRAFQRREHLKVDGVVGKMCFKRAQELGLAVYRRVLDREVDHALVEHSKHILRAHFYAPFGSEFPFEHAGRSYFGRIEQHYHPPGGAMRPWGYHTGVSLFVKVDVAHAETVFHDSPYLG